MPPKKSRFDYLLRDIAPPVASVLLANLRYSHNIINMSQIETPLKPRGGILADEMGLGKMAMLATIVRSLAEARCSTQPHGSSSRMGQARLSSTLIILPLFRLLLYS